MGDDVRHLRARAHVIVDLTGRAAAFDKPFDEVLADPNRSRISWPRPMSPRPSRVSESEMCSLPHTGWPSRSASWQTRQSAPSTLVLSTTPLGECQHKRQPLSDLREDEVAASVVRDQLDEHGPPTPRTRIAERTKIGGPPSGPGDRPLGRPGELTGPGRPTGRDRSAAAAFPGTSSIRAPRAPVNPGLPPAAAPLAPPSRRRYNRLARRPLGLTNPGRSVF